MMGLKVPKAIMPGWPGSKRGLFPMAYQYFAQPFHDCSSDREDHGASRIHRTDPTNYGCLTGGGAPRSELGQQKELDLFERLVAPRATEDREDNQQLHRTNRPHGMDRATRRTVGGATMRIDDMLFWWHLHFCVFNVMMSRAVTGMKERRRSLGEEPLEGGQ